MSVIVFVSEQYSYVSLQDIFLENGITPIFCVIPWTLNSRHVQEAYKEHNNQKIIWVDEDVQWAVLEVFDKQGNIVKRYDGETSQYLLSLYIVDYYIYPLQKLTCRDDFALLEQFKDKGHINFSSNFLERILWNPIIRKIATLPLYMHLLCYVLNEEWMFPKIRWLNAQKIYRNLPYNSGIPVFPKKDAIHEWTFMMHDIYHHYFMDPLLTYSHEDSQDYKAYIMHRMMSESFTLVLADMIMIDHSDIHTSYDTNKRKIFPLFQSIIHNKCDLFDVFCLLYSNARYAVLGDDSWFKQLGASIHALDEYKQKYEVFFSADYQWNYENIQNIIAAIDVGKWAQYRNILPEKIKTYTAKTVKSAIETPAWKLNFDRLFWLFWEKFLKLLMYTSWYSQLEYMKQAILKYISGQLKLLIDFEGVAHRSVDIEEIKTFLESIEWHTSCDLLYKEYIRINNIVHAYIEELLEKEYILPHQAQVYTLHYTHFPVVHINYDKDKERYASISEQVEHIIGNDIEYDQKVHLKEKFDLFMRWKDIALYNATFLSLTS